MPKVLIYSDVSVQVTEDPADVRYENPRFFRAATVGVKTVYTDDAYISKVYQALGADVKPVPDANAGGADAEPEGLLVSRRKSLEKTARELGIPGRLPKSDEDLLEKIKVASAKREDELGEPLTASAPVEGDVPLEEPIAPDSEQNDDKPDDDGGDVEVDDEPTNEQLREALKAKGLPTSGNKAELVKRLRDDDGGDA